MMNNSFTRFLALGLMFVAIAQADDASVEAIKKDRLQIKGKWNVITYEENGTVTKGDDVKNVQVENEVDGKWALKMDGEEAQSGITTIDPTKSPKTIEITITKGEGKGETLIGIYELAPTTRKLCYVQKGKVRPTEFVSTKENGQTLVTFERVKAK